MAYSTPIRAIARSFMRTMQASAAAAAVVAALTVSGAASAKERFAVVVSNTAYKHTADVKFAERDAAAIETALTNVWGVEQANIRRVRNATVGELRYVFGTSEIESSLSAYSGADDSEIFVYFAGHGSKEDDKPYLLGVDSRPDRLAATGFSLDQLIGNLQRFQKRYLKRGRIVLILESCFSGRSHAGELLSDVSAPAFGRPVTISSRTSGTDKGLLILSATRGDQYAVWDEAHQQSVFTDALVSGVFGEADKTSFGGDGNGAVTLNELRGFLKTRIARRLSVVRPGARQTPEVVGGRGDEKLVEIASIKGEWTERFRRVYAEELRAATLLSAPDTKSMKEFLATCLYCPRKSEMAALVRDLKRNAIACEIEAPLVRKLLANGSRRQLRTFLDASKCQQQNTGLEKRYASLPPEDETAINPTGRRKAPPKVSEGDATGLDTRVTASSGPLTGLSFAEILKLKPAVSPIEGLPERHWKKKCTSCHTWKSKNLCNNGKMYVKKPSLVKRHKHPFNGTFKNELLRWAKAGCQ